MKQSLTFVLIALSFLTHAQTDDQYEKFGIPWTEGRIIYSEVIQVPDKTKEEIFNSARLWFSENFKSSKQVLDIDDREMGMLSGRAWGEVTLVTVDINNPYRCWYRILVEVKDGRYRYQIKDIEFEPFSPANAPAIPAEVVLSKSSMFEADGSLNLKNFDFFAQTKKVTENLQEDLRHMVHQSSLSDDW